MSPTYAAAGQAFVTGGVPGQSATLHTVAWAKEVELYHDTA